MFEDSGMLKGNGREAASCLVVEAIESSTKAAYPHVLSFKRMDRNSDSIFIQKNTTLGDRGVSQQ